MNPNEMPWDREEREKREDAERAIARMQEAKSVILNILIDGRRGLNPTERKIVLDEIIDLLGLRSL